MIYQAMLAAKRDFHFLAVKHIEDFVRVVLDVEILRLRHTFLVGNRDVIHSVNTEGDHFFPLIGITYEIIPIILPYCRIGRDDVFLPIAAEVLF